MKARVSLAVLTVLIGIACSREEHRAGTTNVTSAPAQNNGPTIVEPTPTTGAGRLGVSEDRDVAEMVRMRMVADPNLKNELGDVQISVNGPVATLRGTVRTADQRRRVEQAALAVTNIQQVDNELEVTNK
jgi:hypothetical protein